ncbi:polyhydroxyalkanoic acid system family protein [Sphingomonas bacterium]|uniref:polyhydroxyalkanoic acid system family protein n=1 Tax=Sphingomonas bacterium TaxID=1895847 RepID=UPI0015776080|nr:polyhydroxyalkanoic acid system family protein [Sphingomonas bacterium]
MTTQPVEVDIPHTLGKAAARARVEGGFGQIADMIPGGHVTEHHWEGDSLTFTIEALGQRIASRLDIFDARVHATVNLPPFLALFAEAIRAKLAKEGTVLLK